MKAASTSGTSLTKSEPFKTFVTFRIVGDDLNPNQITEFLKIKPTTSYRKGERYYGGDKSVNLLGRTGVWYLSTDQYIESKNLSDHFAFLLMSLLIRGQNNARAADSVQLATNLFDLKRLLDENSLRATITCFWYGTAGSKKPSIPDTVTNIFKLVGAEIESDFDTDESPPALLATS